MSLLLGITAGGPSTDGHGGGESHTQGMRRQFDCRARMRFNSMPHGMRFFFEKSAGHPSKGERGSSVPESHCSMCSMSGDLQV
mmetsp:Transcript_75568/g.171032  ORF Transcript_75568/g.171032 Transcript_75568/m.171032 type:complete len:83 (-) Transcript_75568:52-300(-)